MSASDIPKDRGVEKVHWLEDFYTYLYTPARGSPQCQGLQIPQTVVFKYQRPCAMFYSSDGEIVKRADSKDMQLVNLVRAFVSEPLDHSSLKKTHDVCAFYVCHVREGKRVRTHVEYLDAAGLENFIFYRTKENNGLLQSFVDPAGQCNSLVQVCWTPHECRMESRVNFKEMNDMKVDMNTRAATFDGPEHNSRFFPVKSYKLRRRIKACVDAIVSHASRHLPRGYSLWSMELYFKVCKGNKLMFLWCNDVKLVNETNPENYYFEKPVASRVAPKHVYCYPSHTRSKKELLPSFFCCTSCGEVAHEQRRRVVTFQYVIQHYQRTLPHERDAAIPAEDRCVSPTRLRIEDEEEIIKFKERSCDELVCKFLAKLNIGSDGSLYQGRSIDDFNRREQRDFRRYMENFVHEPDFLQRTLVVCDLCSFKFNKSADELLKNETGKLLNTSEAIGASMNASSSMRSSSSMSNSRSGSIGLKKLFREKSFQDMSWGRRSIDRSSPNRMTAVPGSPLSGRESGIRLQLPKIRGKANAVGTPERSRSTTPGPVAATVLQDTRPITRASALERPGTRGANFSPSPSPQHTDQMDRWTGGDGMLSVEEGAEENASDALEGLVVSDLEGGSPFKDGRRSFLPKPLSPVEARRVPSREKTKVGGSTSHIVRHLIKSFYSDLHPDDSQSPQKRAKKSPQSAKSPYQLPVPFKATPT